MIAMDMFPESLQPEALGLGAVRMAAACFFALYPDDAARERIADCQREHCRRLGLQPLQWRPPELFHVSIAEWGDARRLHEPLDDALLNAREHFSHSPIDVTLVSTARLSAQNGQFAFVFESDVETARQAHSLRNALADAQLHSGLIAARGAIRPHVTIAYGHSVPDEAVPISPIRFRATTVGMIVSKPGARQHHHLDHWNLRNAGNS